MDILDFMVSDFGCFLDDDLPPPQPISIPASGLVNHVQGSPEVITIDEDDDDNVSTADKYQLSKPCLAKLLTEGTSEDVDFSEVKVETTPVPCEETIKEELSGKFEAKLEPDQCPERKPHVVFDEPGHAVLTDELAERLIDALSNPAQTGDVKPHELEQLRTSLINNCRNLIPLSSKSELPVLKPKLKKPKVSEPETKNFDRKKSRANVVKRARDAGLIPACTSAKEYSTAYLLKRLEARKAYQEVRSTMTDRPKIGSISYTISQMKKRKTINSILSAPPTSPVSVAKSISASEANSVDPAAPIDARNLCSLPTNEAAHPKAIEPLSDLYTDDGYKLYIPSTSKATGRINAQVPCRGCWKYFKQSGHTPEPAYFVHCFQECERYKYFGFIKKCDFCKTAFINVTAYRSHFAHCSPPIDLKPAWMSKDIFCTTYVGEPPKYTTREFDVNCPGCQKSFECVEVTDVQSANKTGGKACKEVIKCSLEYLEHTIIECKEYKELGLIVKCHDCHCLFTDREALSKHKIKCEFKSGKKDARGRPRKDEFKAYKPKHKET